MKKIQTLLPDPFYRFHNPISNRIILMVLVLIMAAAAAFPSMARSAETKAAEESISFQTLRTKLINDKNADFTAEQINRIYQNPGVSIDVKGISSYFRHQESKLNYDQFLSSKSIQKATDYMRNHHADLLKAEMDYGVDKEAITAIMLVETRLGTYVGSSPVINILSTMAALEDKTVRDQFWEKIPEKNRVTREAYEKKAVRKAKWAYKELIAFLTYVENEKMEPHNIIGSYAGAMGIAQFMPSNIIILAEDGNKDGSINLFHHEDAIASIANYLKYYGWKPGISREEAGKVIYHYNHSSYYVAIVLKIIDKLKA